MPAPIALVTLTRYPDLFTRLAHSVELFEPLVRKLAVVDADGEAPVFPGWEYLTGQRPFVFARNTNLALRAVGPETDVLLINDDCELVMPLTRELQMIADTSADVGLLTPQIIGDVGNVLQRRNGPRPALIWSRERLAFVCVWVPARTRARVGVLDEEFTGYGGDDRDYSNRCLEQRLGLCITSTVWVRHGLPGGPKASVSFLRRLSETDRIRQIRIMDALARRKAVQRAR